MAWLEPYRDELVGVVVESTYNWYWLVDGLGEQGYTMHLANTVAIQQYDAFSACFLGALNEPGAGTESA